MAPLTEEDQHQLEVGVEYLKLPQQKENRFMTALRNGYW